MQAGRIIGTFINYDNSKTYWLKIGEFGPIKYIEDGDTYITDNDAIYFSEDPINISSEMEDTFENVYVRSCEINLIANFDIRKYVVAENIYDLPVEIRYDDEEGAVIFSGYVVPLSFNQSFAQEWNEFTLNCVDKLGLLDYIKLRPYLTSLNYNTPRFFIDKIIGLESDNSNIPIKFAAKLYNIDYDHTQDTKINPQIFIGESEDDWMTCKEVLEEIGKIYGCYFYQDGDTCVIENIMLYDLSDPYLVQQNDYMSDDTNITIQEAYNRIECTVDLSTLDDTLIDPFKDEYFVPTTERAERVLTQIMQKWSDHLSEETSTFAFMCQLATGNPGTGIHTEPIRNWFKQVGGGAPGPFYYNKADPEVYDTYCQIFDNKAMNFGTNSYLTDGHGSDTKDAWKTLKWLYDNPGKGAFLGFANTDDLVNPSSDAEPKREDLKKMLLIQVNGERQESFFYDTETLFSNQIIYNSPICTFNLQTSNNFVPNDKSTTNYLLFSGNITLNPITPRVCYTGYNDVSLDNWQDSYEIDEWEYTDYWLSWRMAQCPINVMVNYWNLIAGLPIIALGYDGMLYRRVTRENPNDEKGYYLQYYGWDNHEPGFDPVSQRVYPQPPYNQDPNYLRKIALPYLKPKYHKLQYNGASFQKKNGEATKIDNVNYVAVLACELTIGEGADKKYLIEDFSVRENNIWSISMSTFTNLYKWKTYDECPDIGNGEKQTWFTIGINPSPEKNILGENWSIADNTSIEMNIGDKKGTAIPIYSNSGLLGPVSFKILGPYNTTWDHNYAVKHGAWFWKWYSTAQTENVSILAFTENIQITDFKIELVSNNSSSDANNDNDLVYYSYENNIYQENKDFSCKFCTSLTNADIQALDINYEPNNSAILGTNNQPWYGMTYKGVSNVKLEEARVSEQYNIWKRPRSIVTTTLKLVNPENAYLKTNYIFDYLKYENDSLHIYRTLNRKINLKYDTMECTMKELSEEPTN